MSKKAKVSYNLYRQQRGDLASLATTEKTNLVGAINEVKSTSAPSGHVGSGGVTQHPLGDGTAAGFSLNNYTNAEKTKLAGLESSHFRGTFTGLAALTTAIPAANQGDYADVDGGLGSDVERYIWDDSDGTWTAQQGASTAETAASIKSKYESNADTNAYTDGEKTKLWGITSEATKTEASATNGNIKINGTETVVFIEVEITETAYQALTEEQKLEQNYIVIPG